MESLLIHEEVFGYADDLVPRRTPEEHRQKRHKAVATLTKRQNQLLCVEVIGFLAEYRRLCYVHDMVCGIIDGLDYHHTPVKQKDGGAILHPGSYLE